MPAQGMQMPIALVSAGPSAMALPALLWHSPCLCCTLLGWSSRQPFGKLLCSLPWIDSHYFPLVLWSTARISITAAGEQAAELGGKVGCWGEQVLLFRGAAAPCLGSVQEDLGVQWSSCPFQQG